VGQSDVELETTVEGSGATVGNRNGGLFTGFDGATPPLRQAGAVGARIELLHKLCPFNNTGSRRGM